MSRATMPANTGERRAARMLGHRLQILFAPESYDRLARLKEAVGATSLADVLRDALRVYEWFVNQRSDGYDIALVKDGKVEKVVELMF